MTGVVAGLLAMFMLQAAPAKFDEIARKAAEAREANRAEESVRLYREAVRLRPAWAEGWWYLGTLLYERDQYSPARDAFARFTKLDSGGGPGWAMLGLCEYRIKEYDQAQAHLQTGLKLGLGANPDLTHVARLHKAMLLTRAGEFEAAMQLFVVLAADSINDSRVTAAAGLAALRIPVLPPELPPAQQEMVFQVGQAVCDTGARRVAQSRQEWEEIVSKYGTQPHIHYLYGGYLLIGDSEAAVREWKKELEISPKHVPARLELAYEYLKRGDPASALPYAEQAATLEPDSFMVHNALGRVLSAIGESERSITELELACKLAPLSPENHAALASAYARAGRKQAAGQERAEFLRLKKEQEP